MARGEIKSEVDFTWWKVWSWLCFLPGTLIAVVAYATLPNGYWYGWLALFNALVSVCMMNYSREGFLITTILSLNPVLWIINGIYLNNRWNHPLVVGGSWKVTEMPATAIPVKTFDAEPMKVPAVTEDDYRRVAEEIALGKIDKGLWTKLFVESDGDDNKTRARYIKARVKQGGLLE